MLVKFYRYSDSQQKTISNNGQNIVKNKPDYINKKDC